MPLIDGEFISLVRAKQIPGKKRDYSSLATWESDRQGDVGDLTASGFLEVAEVEGPGSVGTVVIAGWTTDATSYILVRAAQGHEATHKYRTNKAFIQASAADGIRVSAQQFTRIEGMTIRQTGTFEAISMENANGYRVQKNFCWGGLGIFIEGRDSGGANQSITHSNIIIGAGNGGTRAAINTATALNAAHIHRVYNNTVISGNDCIKKTDSNNTQSRNNYFHPNSGVGGIVYDESTEMFAGNQHDITANIESLVGNKFRHLAFDNPKFFNDPHNKDFGIKEFANPFRGSGQNMNVPPASF